MLIRSIIIFSIASSWLISCATREEKLPILGRKQISANQTDTTYHTIGDFTLVDQDSNRVTNETFDNTIYVADFFFTSCPTICPIMKTQMLRVYEKFKDNPEVKLLSHTIDPEYDTVALLHDYAERLGVSGDTWHFVTGDKSSIYALGKNSYMVTAQESETEPGGFLHSGAFILVDKNQRIRGIYDGTEEEAVNQLISDIPKLLREYH